jgi:hypothetical protein
MCLYNAAKSKINDDKKLGKYKGLEDFSTFIRFMTIDNVCPDQVFVNMKGHDHKENHLLLEPMSGYLCYKNDNSIYNFRRLLEVKFYNPFVKPENPPPCTIGGLFKLLDNCFEGKQSFTAKRLKSWLEYKLRKTYKLATRKICKNHNIGKKLAERWQPHLEYFLSIPVGSMLQSDWKGPTEVYTRGNTPNLIPVFFKRDEVETIEVKRISYQTKYRFEVLESLPSSVSSESNPIKKKTEKRRVKVISGEPNKKKPTRWDCLLENGRRRTLGSWWTYKGDIHHYRTPDDLKQRLDRGTWHCDKMMPEYYEETVEVEDLPKEPVKVKVPYVEEVEITEKIQRPKKTIDKVEDFIKRKNEKIGVTLKTRVPQYRTVHKLEIKDEVITEDINEERVFEKELKVVSAEWIKKDKWEVTLEDGRVRKATGTSENLVFNDDKLTDYFIHDDHVIYNESWWTKKTEPPKFYTDKKFKQIVNLKKGDVIKVPHHVEYKERTKDYKVENRRVELSLMDFAVETANKAIRQTVKKNRFTYGSKYLVTENILLETMKKSYVRKDEFRASHRYRHALQDVVSIMLNKHNVVKGKNVP